jgi:hypothetical protein
MDAKEAAMSAGAGFVRKESGSSEIVRAKYGLGQADPREACSCVDLIGPRADRPQC